MKALESAKREAKSGACDSLVIFVHGYGADGNDLLSIGGALAEHLPGTEFAAPNGPDACVGNPAGYQWFPIPWLDGSSEVEAATAMFRSADLLNTYVDAAMEAAGVGAARTILFGFSQGTMMSLHIAPRRKNALAGIVGFSGRLLQPEALMEETLSRPPVFLAHGDSDEMVPFASMAMAEKALVAAGFDVQTHVSKGMGHGIAPDALGKALSFIKAWLGG